MFGGTRYVNEMLSPSFPPLPDFLKCVAQSPIHSRFINAGCVALILLFIAKGEQREMMLISILLEDLKTVVLTVASKSYWENLVHQKCTLDKENINCLRSNLQSSDNTGSTSA